VGKRLITRAISGAFIHKANALGFVVAKPYGHNHPYDFIVGGRKWLSEHTDKGLRRHVARLISGVHQPPQRRHRSPYRIRGRFYSGLHHSPKTPGMCSWYVFPVRQVIVRTSVGFRPKGYARGHPTPTIARHLLREPDGLTFG
jgi:hypothetical protein